MNEDEAVKTEEPKPEEKKVTVRELGRKCGSEILNALSEKMCFKGLGTDEVRDWCRDIISDIMIVTIGPIIQQMSKQMLETVTERDNLKARCKVLEEEGEGNDAAEEGPVKKED